MVSKWWCFKRPSRSVMNLKEWMGVTSQADLKRKIRYLSKKIGNPYIDVRRLLEELERMVTGNAIEFVLLSEPSQDDMMIERDRIALALRHKAIKIREDVAKRDTADQITIRVQHVLADELNSIATALERGTL
jgi:hypothetical protein